MSLTNCHTRSIGASIRTSTSIEGPSAYFNARPPFLGSATENLARARRYRTVPIRPPVPQSATPTFFPHQMPVNALSNVAGDADQFAIQVHARRRVLAEGPLPTCG